LKEYKAPDKVVQKMTRAGAEVQNLATGEAENISSRPDDSNISEQPVNMAGKVIDRLDKEHTCRSSKKAAKKARKTSDRGMEVFNRPSSRLQFSEEERAAPELQKSIRKSNMAADKLDMAQENIPKKKKLVRERTFDEAAGKGKTRLHFKETEKPFADKMRHSLLSRPVQEMGMKLHGKVYEVEKENVGVEGGHAAERLGEKIVSKGYRLVKGGIRRHKLKPYRAAARAEQSAIKANVDFMYQKALRDNSRLASSNPLSRFLQKQQIKRNYAQQIRDAGKTAQSVGGTVKSAAKKAKEAAENTVKFIARNWKGVLVLLALGLFIIFLLGGLQSCSALFGGASSSVIATSYLSEDTDMLAAEAAYSAMESELQYELDDFESLHPGYDEYRYHLDGIYHDPHELAAYLSAKHTTYTASDVQRELERLFGLQYDLDIQETVEIRYRTETYTETWTDEDGIEHTDTHTEEVPYEYTIVTVTLKNKGLFFIVQSELTPEQKKLYDIYRQTLGNMPLLFGGGSVNNNPSTDLSGVRFVDGKRPGNQAVVDIAKSQEGNVGGYPYWSWYGFNGRVEWCACFVSWIYNQAGYSEPRFAACTSQGRPWFQSRGQWGDRYYADIAPGDAIFFDWDGDGTADHVGIVIGTDGTTVYTVEGNSGDACKIRSYPVGSSVIDGYGLMNW